MLIDKLLDTCTDEQTAAGLNKQQLSNWKGESFTAKKVKQVRLNHGLKSRYQRLRDLGFLTQAEMCKRYAVSSTTIYNWAHAGLLQRERWGNRLNCLYALSLASSLPKAAEAILDQARRLSLYQLTKRR